MCGRLSTSTALQFRTTWWYNLRELSPSPVASAERPVLLPNISGRLFSWRAPVEEPKRNTKRRWIVGGLAAFVAFIAVKFTEDTFKDRGNSCVQYGGKPADRGWFQETPSCTWPESFVTMKLEPWTGHVIGKEAIEAWCRKNRGALTASDGGRIRCQVERTSDVIGGRGA